MTNSIRIHAGLLSTTAGCVQNTRPRIKIDPTHPRADRPLADDTLLSHKAVAVYLANELYAEVLKQDNPAATLDDIADALPDLFATMGATDTLLPEVADRVWAFSAIAHARAEVGDAYGYVLDILADNVRHGRDPQAVRDEVPRIVARLRIENAISTAVDAITAAMTTGLAGLTTNPREVADRLHTAIDDAQAEHRARPTVGDMSLEAAESAEAVSTASEAMARALASSPDPERTARGLRHALRMAIDEARP
ncbi:hypothetical protein [Streptomyces stelliscabiei]|uniref:hypothetical protein n=1 Tax=Streptomyces stelliscabiei TaxID=146820 RepID=UPI002FEFB865